MSKPSRVMLAPLALLLSVVLIACSTAGQPSPKPSESTQPKPAAESPKPSASPSPSASAADKPLSPPVNVRVGVLGSMSDAGIFIALEKGYFKEQGLNIEVSNFDSAARMVAPMAAGQLDVGAGSPSAGLYNAIARDIPLKIVADKGSTPKGFGFIALSVRKDLLDSGQVKSVADLKGRTVAINAKATSTEITLDKALEKGGVSLKDVNEVEMGFPDMNAALSNNGIDAAVYIEPNVVRGESLGVAVRYLPGDEIYPNQQVATILYAPGFMKDNPEAAKRWMIAYLKGVRYYNDAFAKKDAKAKSDIVPVLIKYTPMKDAKLYDEVAAPGLNPDGYVNAKGIVDDFNWYVKMGQVNVDPGKVGINSVVDNSWADYAVQKLGKYK